MPESLRPSPVSGYFSALRFRLRFITVVFSMMVIFGSFTTSLSQSRPADAASQNEFNVTKQPPAAIEPQANPAIVADPSQSPIHVVPFGRNSAVIKPQFAPAGAHLTYFGGPIISNVQVVVVFWGPNVTSAVTANGTIDQFYTDITSSRFFDLLTEYSTAGVTGPPPSGTNSSNQTLGHGTFAGKFTITPALCPGPAACTVTDGQIQTELLRQISNSVLPAPQTDAHGIINTYYAIYFPPGVTITLDTSSSCVIGGFCAYHSNTGNLIPYGVLPDFAPPSACSRGCGGGTQFQNITAVSSHELSEAVTDAQVGSATIFGPPLGWYNGPTPNLGEIADICDGQDTLVNAGSATYMVQRDFSNVQNDCVNAPPIFNMTAPTAGAGPSLPFNLTLAVENSNGQFPLVGYSGTVHFTSSDPQAILPADYTFVSGDAGTHTFSVTLATLGDQTISVVDTHASGFTGTTTVNVNTAPDLTITKSHSGNFFVGQTGASYTITASNAGRGPTVGTVTVTDTLPTGLTATAISGTGWSCTLGNLTCTRGDTLAAGSNSSYPPITLTVNVAANAVTQVLNTATVSGGGETNTANDMATDLTIIAAPDITISKVHTGAINGAFFQGETGATYSIFVTNNGTLTSSGAVTVVDMLPAAGLTATAISGTGWNCTLGNLTCIRSDALAPGISYPVITVTVDVAIDAPANVVNTATVSGGGEVNTSNDLVQDLTIILPPPHPDLTIATFHPGSFIQGQSGTYFINVSNVGTANTSGTVTVTDTIPAGLTATSISGTGWNCTLGTPLVCSRSDALAFNAAYPTITIAVDIAANAPASVTNTASVTGGGDTNNANNNASDFTSIATAVIDLRFTLFAAGGLSVGDTNQLLIFGLENAGNVPSSGPITVTAAVTTGLTVASISGPGWNCTLSTLTCTRSDSVPGNFNGAPEIDIRVNVALNAPARVTTTLTVSGGGDTVPGNNTFGFDQNVNGPVTINIFPATAAVNAGQTATIPLSVGLAQAAGSVTFSCTGLPTASTCAFNPPSATLSSSSLVTLTITTTARSASVPAFRIPIGGWPTPLLLGLSLLGLWALFLKNRQRSVSLKPVFAGSLTVALVLAALAGCGGSGSPPPPPPVVGTPAGTYAISVTGTTPIGATSTTLSLTVR